jgi:hypothetical protein
MKQAAGIRCSRRPQFSEARVLNDPMQGIPFDNTAVYAPVSN